MNENIKDAQNTYTKDKNGNYIENGNYIKIHHERDINCTNDFIALVQLNGSYAHGFYWQVLYGDHEICYKNATLLWFLRYYGGAIVFKGTQTGLSRIEIVGDIKTHDYKNGKLIKRRTP